MQESPKYYALGLKLGLLGESEIQDWVNEQIRMSETPADNILDLAYSSNSDVKEIYSQLTAMPDDRTDFDVLRSLLPLVQDSQLNDLDFCRQLANNLYVVFGDNDYKCPKDFNEIGFLDDSFCLAIQKTYGTLEDAQKALVEFVKSFRKNC